MRKRPDYGGRRVASSGLALCSFVLTSGFALAEPAGPAATESVHEALCRLIETAAREHGVAADFLTNLIWRESNFSARAVSRRGAQGIAQVMPSTAAERGLADPFDPEQAIPQAARLLADLARRFGNLGLAAAAYNAGAGRVSRWLAKEVALPPATRNFVLLVTGRTPEDWAAQGKAGFPQSGAAPASCTAIVASVHRSGRHIEEARTPRIEETPRIAKARTPRIEEIPRIEEGRTTQIEKTSGIEETRTTHIGETPRIEEARTTHIEETPRVEEARATRIGETLRIEEARTTHIEVTPRIEETSTPSIDETPLATWGVQVAGNFSKEIALASFARVRERFASELGEVRPMIIGTQLRNRGTTAFYRVRVPADSRTAADTLCNRIRSAGGACVVLRNSPATSSEERLLPTAIR